MSRHFPQTWPTRLGAHGGLWLALGIGVALKATILATHSITFDADEAILALMARHILRGEHPLFFYGQSYMGALDAYLTVPFFLIFGQTVVALRLLQITLYAAVVVTTYGLALRLSADPLAASAAALLVSLPPVLFSLYTSSTLGDYGETLVLNNLLFLIGWDIVTGRKESAGWWLAAGILAGVGWWSMGLIVVSLVPLIAVGLWRFRRRLPWHKLIWGAAGFAVGASPWIYATVARGPGSTISDLSGSWFSGPTGIGARGLSLILFNIPALFGLRPPWSVEWIALPVGIIVAGFYGVVLWQTARFFVTTPSSKSGETVVGDRRIGLLLLLSGIATLLALFLLTPFGGDPTGRYLLPLYPILAVLVGDWLGRVYHNPQVVRSRWGQIGAVAILLVCLSYNLWGNVRSVLENPPGITKQFDPISQIPPDHDAELVAFLDSIGADRGYSNYWVTFRFAFLTQERIIFSPRLPYKIDLSYTYGDDRYPPYSSAVQAAPKVVYVTSNHPALDLLIEQRLEQLHITFDERKIGPYTVFYDLSRKVTPDDLGPFGAVSGAAIHDQ